MNPVITKIEIDQDKLEQLRSVLKTSVSKMQKNGMIKKYVGGLCLNCYEIPTILVTYDVSDSEMSAKKIERYCDNCFKNSGIGITSKDKVRITATNGKDHTIAEKMSIK